MLPKPSEDRLVKKRLHKNAAKGLNSNSREWATTIRWSVCVAAAPPPPPQLLLIFPLSPTPRPPLSSSMCPFASSPLSPFPPPQRAKRASRHVERRGTVQHNTTGTAHSTLQRGTATQSTARYSVAQPRIGHHITAQHSAAQPSPVQPKPAQSSTAIAQHNTAEHLLLNLPLHIPFLGR